MTQRDLFGQGADPFEGLHLEHRPGALAAVANLAVLDDAIDFFRGATHMYGKAVKVPRGEAWYGERPYSFGGRTWHPIEWPSVLVQIRGEVERRTGQRFDSCFANRYDDGQDCIPWHADDETWIGPWIASVSYGGARRFVLRRKDDHQAKREWVLRNGDLFVMGPGVQATCEHTVPRTKQPRRPRINLTFRQTVGG